MLTSSRYQLRPMSEADIPQVSAIEDEAFATQWPRTAYKRELENKLARYLVVTDKAQDPPPPAQPKQGIWGLFRRREPLPPPADYVVGYVGVWLMVNEAHIVAIAVRKGYRGKGLGELLLAEAIELAIDNEQENVTLEVRRSNQVAQRLYEKYRFLNVGIRKRYYSDNREDAVIMSTGPIQDAAYREHLQYLHDQFERRWGEGAQT